MTITPLTEERVLQVEIVADGGSCDGGLPQMNGMA